jgi:arginine N-succinyltransferase
MFVIRNVNLKDLEDIFELSQLMQFINIPNDKDLLETKIQKSLKSFKGELSKEESTYIFVLEDLQKKKVIGISLIHGLHGTEEEPHFYLTVGQEHKYSQSLNTGFIHGTLKFGHTTKGFTEIGGLVLNPTYRGHEQKLGKALSFARFLFIGQNKSLFTDTIHVELMPPFDSEGKSPLWEAVGRQFLNMNYHDADILSRKNKEFILSLFPHDTIYEALLPLAARDAIGKVGEQTAPVKRMLESIGFEYVNEVDPFDGGPHYRAALDKITKINQIKSYTVVSKSSDKKQCFLLSTQHPEHTFYCPLLSGQEIQGENGDELIIDPKIEKEKFITQPSGLGFSY